MCCVWVWVCFVCVVCVWVCVVCVNVCVCGLCVFLNIFLFSMLHYEVILNAFVSNFHSKVTFTLIIFLHFLLLRLLNYHLVIFIPSWGTRCVH